ncbi:MAG: hypothetical protein H0Z37_01895 [Firmicutes bacterium]|nr:hypothetical protein [Bacillota bacterium]
MLHGLSSRRYRNGLEPAGQDLPTSDTSKSAVSRQFIRATRQSLEKLLSPRPDYQRILVLTFNGLEMTEPAVVVSGEREKRIVAYERG